MAKLTTVLHEEIRRLARKEIREQVGKTLKQVAAQRKEIAALKRQNDSMQKRIDFLEKREKRRLEQPAVAAKAKAGSAAPAAEQDSTPRFSPKWLSAHREKLELSAADYAQLVGCSPLSIYKWEKGENTPRAKQRESLAAIRGIGKREAMRRLELLNK
ncbi:MAG: helix-turn-helix domain-containing protein [Phycisphaerales bacterium JB063]